MIVLCSFVGGASLLVLTNPLRFILEGRLTVVAPWLGLILLLRLRLKLLGVAVPALVILCIKLF